MEMSKILSAESDYERDLKSIERRLIRIERQSNLLVGLAGFGLIPLFGRLFMPRLWTYEQYSSRHLRISEKYLAEPIPKNPLRFAIVTPSLNQSDFIRATIDSVLQQNYPNLAYLVQDGGSRIATIDILKSYGDRLQWRSENDSGQANAINRGFKQAHGDIMAYLNSDDVLLPGTLAYVASLIALRKD